MSDGARDLAERAQKHAAHWGCGSREGIANVLVAFANQESASLRERVRVLEAEITRLCDMIDNRNEFIAKRGLWRELGQYLSEPHPANEPSTASEQT